MGTFKIYDETKRQWIPVTSNNANNVMTGSSSIVEFVNKKQKTSKSIVSVENTLEEILEDVKILHGNINWLANQERLQPPPSSTDPIILVKGVKSGSISGVILHHGEPLEVGIAPSAQLALRDWDIVIRSGEKVIKKGTDIHYPYSIPWENLKDLGESFDLVISTKFSTRDNYLIWTGTVYII